MQAAPIFSSVAWPRPLLPAVSRPFSFEVESLIVGGFSLSELHLEGDLRADRSLTATVCAPASGSLLAGLQCLTVIASGSVEKRSQPFSVTRTVSLKPMPNCR